MREAWEEAMAVAQEFIEAVRVPRHRGSGYWIPDDIYASWMRLERQVPEYKKPHAYINWYKKQIEKIQRLVALRPNWHEIADDRETQEAAEEVLRAAVGDTFSELVGHLRAQASSGFCWDMAGIIERATSPVLSDVLTERQFAAVRENWGKWHNGNKRRGSEAFNHMLAEFDEKFGVWPE